MAGAYSKPVPMESSSRIKGWKPVEIIPIHEAVLCADCDAITRATNDHCLACGSHAIVHVEKLMNRQMSQVSGVRDQGSGQMTAAKGPIPEPPEPPPQSDDPGNEAWRR